jgi:methylated-DNA-[protein]-cysteine S-methyltransferase
VIAALPTVELYAFETDLGWMAALSDDGGLTQLCFGGDSPQASISRLDAELAGGAQTNRRLPAWVQLLKRYAAGEHVDLNEIRVGWPESLTAFQQQVLEACREIPYGRVATYGELAAQCGYPGAARAVGNVMAANRVPIVIPCHRVVPAGGQLGRYSAPGGVRMKLRLLEMEGCRQSLRSKVNVPLGAR